MAEYVFELVVGRSEVLARRTLDLDGDAVAITHGRTMMEGLGTITARTVSIKLSLKREEEVEWLGSWSSVDDDVVWRVGGSTRRAEP